MKKVIVAKVMEDFSELKEFYTIELYVISVKLTVI